MKEFVLDTNVFIRYFIKDIKTQYEKAKKLFQEIENQKHKGLVSILVINEIIWILENYYDLKRTLYIPTFLKLLALKNMKIVETRKNVLFQILEAMQKSSLDFTDSYLLYSTNRDKIFSFDKDFKKTNT